MKLRERVFLPAFAAVISFQAFFAGFGPAAGAPAAVPVPHGSPVAVSVSFDENLRKKAGAFIEKLLKEPPQEESKGPFSRAAGAFFNRLASEFLASVLSGIASVDYYALPVAGGEFSERPGIVLVNFTSECEASKVFAEKNFMSALLSAGPSTEEIGFIEKSVGPLRVLYPSAPRTTAENETLIFLHKNRIGLALCASGGGGKPYDVVAAAAAAAADPAASIASNERFVSGFSSLRADDNVRLYVDASSFRGKEPDVLRYVETICAGVKISGGADSYEIEAAVDLADFASFGAAESRIAGAVRSLLSGDHAAGRFDSAALPASTSAFADLRLNFSDDFLALPEVFAGRGFLLMADIDAREDILSWMKGDFFVAADVVSPGIEFSGKKPFAFPDACAGFRCSDPKKADALVDKVFAVVSEETKGIELKNSFCGEVPVKTCALRSPAFRGLELTFGYSAGYYFVASSPGYFKMISAAGSKAIPALSSSPRASKCGPFENNSFFNLYLDIASLRGALAAAFSDDPAAAAFFAAKTVDAFGISLGLSGNRVTARSSLFLDPAAVESFLAGLESSLRGK